MRVRRWLSWAIRRAAFVLLVLAGVGASAEELLPRTGRVTVERVHVRSGPSVHEPVVGLLEFGEEVDIVGCDPNCEAPSAWALLEPEGAFPLRDLSFEPDAPEAAEEPFTYARVRRGGAEVRAGPAATFPVLDHFHRGDVLALTAMPEDDTGFARLTDGAYVDSSQVKVIHPSRRAGIHDPPQPVAFVVDKSKLPRDVVRALPRSRVLSVHGVAGELVFTDLGAIPRAAVRLAFAQPRPPAVPEGARWVYIDLGEQTLTAYEGDRWVFATVISTGRRGWETPTGLTQVWLKVRHGLMEGSREPYHVEEVPHTMYFNRGDALHGATWHDHFGHAVSHGCVNLPPADAEWLFDWAPPEVPPGWRGVYPLAAGMGESLWVDVEQAAPVVMLQSVDGTAPAWVPSPST